MSNKTLKLPEEKKVTISPVQVPPALHGSHALTPLQIDLNQNINPATGLPYAQVMGAPRGGMISPPPTKYFK